MILQVFLIEGENVQKVPQTGLETTILGSGGWGLIHEATKAHDTETEMVLCIILFQIDIFQIFVK